MISKLNNSYSGIPEVENGNRTTPTDHTPPLRRKFGMKATPYGTDARWVPL